MLTVAITAPIGAASLGTAGLMDALKKADAAWRFEDAGDGSRLFDVALVGLDEQPVPCRDGVYLHPSVGASALPTPDLVIVPGLDDDLADSFVQNRGWAPWIARWHTQGARIASSCTGAFLVADAGLLDGRPVTTHWLYADELQHCYPRVRLSIDQMIVDDGDILSSGGATAFLNLVLYIVERFGGRERATLAAKVLLVDGRDSQLPYIAFSPDRSHDDRIVHQIQQHIDMHLPEPILVGDLATRFGVGTRTLSRRFVAATGLSPQAYLQRARVQYAQRLLENTGETVDEIRGRVGYQDPAAFRRAFKDAAGLTPSEYRKTYGLRRANSTS